MPAKYDLITVGSGPAGVSASIYARRAGCSVLMIGMGGGSLSKAERIENYYGFTKPVTGAELIAAGIAQARALGVSHLKAEVTGVAFGDGFEVSTGETVYLSSAVILATGASRAAPKIPGLRELEGSGVSYCAVCDAFFYRGKPVAVLGNGSYALHEAEELAHVASSVTLITNGTDAPSHLPSGIKADTRRVVSILGKDKVSGASFADGGTLPFEGLFIAVGVAGSTDLARKLGAAVEGSRILTEADMSTNVPGLFAAGDCRGGMYQIAKAVYDGAAAGTACAAYVRKQK